MDHRSVSRAWRDPIYRARLDQETRDRLPRHPAGDSRDAAFALEWLFGDEGGPIDPKITGTAGCGTPGCTQVVCTDPCLSFGPNCTNDTRDTSLIPCCPAEAPTSRTAAG